MLNISNRRECFFDSYLINEEKTTAERRLHKLRRRETIMEMNMPWEGNVCGYHCAFFAEGLWRMYYRCSQSGRAEPYVAYAESRDGISWVRPSLGIVEFEGSRDNNLILDLKMLRELDYKGFDNMYVFYDENPQCKPSEKYKMLSMWVGHGALLLLVSSDGIHFEMSRTVTKDGEFDSQNIALWSPELGKYLCYYRGEHDGDKSTPVCDKSYTDKQAKALLDPEKMLLREPGAGTDAFMRDVRVIESRDFIDWSEQRRIEATGADLQFYTNCIMRYPRAPHLLVALPMRYVERKAWTPTYDELCGREARLRRMSGGSLRSGLAITDGLFMCSRDGYSFTKYDEAILPPPPENPESFVYGDGFALPALIETPSDIPGADNEYTVLVNEGYRSELGPNRLVKYTARLDGFVSRHAGGEEKVIITKPFIYEGGKLFANIATSARGYAYFTLRCEAVEFTSYEVFGNSVDKQIHFEGNAVESLSGREVILEVRLFDCDLYAIRFGEKQSN